MSEPTTAAVVGYSAGSGTTLIAFLAAAGINPDAMISGLIGCVIVQALMRPKEPRTFASIATLTIGGVLLASVLAPLAAPWFVQQFATWAPSAPSGAVRAAMAACIGGFAQKIITLFSGWISARGQKEIKDA